MLIGIGDIEENFHSADEDSTGDFRDNLHSIVASDTGNVNSLRRGQRIRKQPKFYGVSDVHFAFSAQQFVQNDPISISDAMQRDDWQQWRKAVNEEYSSLMKNHTWTLCDLPPNRKVISCKWVFKLKRKSNGEVSKYKARLVARGFSQEKGFDYNETYSPTAKLKTFRVLMSVANHFGYFIHQMDVKSAFLNGRLNEVIYMKQPEGFMQDDSKVCKLEKSLYGLKQASKMWNERFHEFMIEIGFKRCWSDQCLYVIFIGSTVCYVLLYVDDLLFISNNMQTIDNIKIRFKNEFEMTDIGKVDTFLGISVEHDEKSGVLSMNQTHYLKNVLRKFGMENSKTVATPMELRLHLEKEENDQKCNVPYRELIGCLIYATITTRPDLCAATNYFKIVTLRSTSCMQNVYCDTYKEQLI